MFILKGVSILTNLAFVPLLIDVLNVEKYGVWVTISTITAWLAFFDVGLGHGLRNKLSEALADNDKMLGRQYISTSYLVMIFVVSILLVLDFLISPLISWSSVLNTDLGMEVELDLLVTLVIALSSFQFLFKLLTSIMYAFQLPAISALLVTAGQFFSFLVIYILTQIQVELSLMALGVIICSSPIFVLVLASFFVFGKKYKEFSPRFSDFRKDLVKPVMSLGLKFFSIQITSMLLFQSNNFIVAHVSGPEYVAEFNVAYKYIGLISMGFTIIMVPYWSATTEAFKRREFHWIKMKIKDLNKLWFLFCLFGGVLLVVSPYLYKLWLGGRIQPDFILLSLMLANFIFHLRWVLFGNLINGIGKIKLQFFITLIELLIHIPLAFFLGSVWGIYGVLCSMIFIGIVNSFWPKIQLNRILNSKAKGIWFQ
ncbi:MAG: oligosaccharide flippase family protein [Cytophagia bacterium]|nr:oligosaccharide flippase family protein [Cytophagia bacterium]